MREILGEVKGTERVKRKEKGGKNESKLGDGVQIVAERGPLLEQEGTPLGKQTYSSSFPK